MEKVTILSNFQNNDAKTEDKALVKLLGKYFETQINDLFDDSILSKDSFFLIRNIWGREGFRERMAKIYRDFDQRKIPYSNPFTGKGDQQGKRYLVDLFNIGYPVVPIFDDLKKALTQGSKEYLVKPIYGGSGKGILTISASDIAQFDNTKYLIQPKIDFSCELSFFFVDNKFSHALETKEERWDLGLYSPSKKELSIACEFIDWNPLKGVQRIDFLKKREGDILLLEIEDWCPYLSISDVPGLPIDSFVSAIAQSISEG